MKKSSFILLGLAASFFACSNDDGNTIIDPNQQTPIETNFYALKVGNYWKYEYFMRIGRTLEFENTGIFDEVYITGASEIDGETFYVFETTTSGDYEYRSAFPKNGTVITKRRDSLGYLINESGTILYSNINPGEEYFIYDSSPVTSVYGVLLRDTENVQVEAGTFETLVNKVYVRLESGKLLPGKVHYFYSENIGEIQSEISFTSDSIHIGERRLVEYRIAE